MMLKKSVVFLTVILWIATLAISFFVGMRYNNIQTTEIEISQEEPIKENSGYVLEIPQEEPEKENSRYIVEIPISDVESIAKEQDNGITKEEAERLCLEIMGDKADENGFPISYRCISAVSANDKLYYVMHITWLVDNHHWSYIGNCYVSSDGKEIYDGIVSPARYEMTRLKWRAQ